MYFTELSAQIQNVFIINTLTITGRPQLEEGEILFKCYLKLFNECHKMPDEIRVLNIVQAVNTRFSLTNPTDS